MAGACRNASPHREVLTSFVGVTLLVATVAGCLDDSGDGDAAAGGTAPEPTASS